MADVPVNDHEDFRKSMWVNPTDNNSLRLTLAGLQWVAANLNLVSYKFELPEQLTNANLLQLERLFQGPYYLLHRKRLYVFEEQEALMLTLLSGDLKTYLDNLSKTNQGD